MESRQIGHDLPMIDGAIKVCTNLALFARDDEKEDDSIRAWAWGDGAERQRGSDSVRTIERRGCGALVGQDKPFIWHLRLRPCDYGP